MRSICLIIACLFGNLLMAQDAINFSSSESTLVQLSQDFLKDSIPQNRIKAARAFKEELKATLANDNSFQHPFFDLETVSILYPADSTFRIFTWQLYVNKNDYRYGGIVQMNNEKNEVFVLQDQSAEIATYDLEYDVLGKDDWYGAIYFNLEEYDSKDGKKYLLFGFDGFEFFNKRKVLEALYFDESGQPQFGAPAFAKTAEGYEASTKNRLYLEYSAEVAARLNYDPNLDMIILDNLISMKSPYRGGGNVNIPDGSYEGYKLNNGVWEYVEKVFHQVSVRPPAPRKVFNDKAPKDIFGKAGKKRDKTIPMKN